MSKFCSNCGKPVSENAAFCENCGARLKGEASGQPQQPSQQSQPLQQTQPVQQPAFQQYSSNQKPPVYQQPVSKKNNVPIIIAVCVAAAALIAAAILLLTNKKESGNDILDDLPEGVIVMETSTENGEKPEKDHSAGVAKPGKPEKAPEASAGTPDSIPSSIESVPEDMRQITVGGLSLAVPRNYKVEGSSDEAILYHPDYPDVLELVSLNFEKDPEADEEEDILKDVKEILTDLSEETVREEPGYRFRHFTGKGESEGTTVYASVYFFVTKTELYWAGFVSEAEGQLKALEKTLAFDSSIPLPDSIQWPAEIPELEESSETIPTKVETVAEDEQLIRLGGVSAAVPGDYVVAGPENDMLIACHPDHPGYINMANISHLDGFTPGDEDEMEQVIADVFSSVISAELIQGDGYTARYYWGRLSLDEYDKDCYASYYIIFKDSEIYIVNFLTEGDTGDLVHWEGNFAFDPSIPYTE